VIGIIKMMQNYELRSLQIFALGRKGRDNLRVSFRACATSPQL